MDRSGLKLVNILKEEVYINIISKGNHAKKSIQ